MPQNVKYLFTKDTVKEEIRADTAAKLGIAECLNQHPFDLSGGQAQKLAFGILLEQDADIFLLDEPTQVRRITKRYLESAVSMGDIV